MNCYYSCLLYTSDAADDTPCVDLGGRRIIKNGNNENMREVFDDLGREEKTGWGYFLPVSYTHLTLPTILLV